MTQAQVNEAIAEAQRFIAKAEKYKDFATFTPIHPNKYHEGFVIEKCPVSVTAAIKRASMDLSKSLVELRK